MGNTEMKLDQKLRMIFYLFILLYPTVRWCQTPRGRRQGET